MTIRARLATTADRLFDRFASFVQTATYNKAGVPTYDATTGTVTQTPTATAVGLIFEDWREDQIDGTIIRAGDRKAMVRAVQITGAPTTDDTVTINSKLWAVIGWSTDPGAILYTLHIRALP